MKLGTDSKSAYSPRRAAGRRRRALVALLLSALFVLSSGSALLAAPTPPPNVQVSIAKDAYWYAPNGTMRLTVSVENQDRQPLKSVSVRLKLHSAMTARSDLDAVLDGKNKRTVRNTRTLQGDTTLPAGHSSLVFDVGLADYSLTSGVYPLTVELLRSGTVIASAASDAVVMENLTASSIPLRLSLIFDLMEPAHRGPDGKFRDDSLADECSQSGRSPGWLAGLVTEAQAHVDLKLNFAAPALLLSEMADMTDGYVVSNGQKDTRMSAQSPGAQDAAKTLEGFRQLATQPRLQFLPTPYASPDVEQLWSLKWTADASQQISTGFKKMEELLKTHVNGDCFYPPGGFLDSKTIKGLDGEIGKLLVLGPQLLGRSSEGRELASGLTLVQPVAVKGATDTQDTALFSDARMEGLIGRIGGYDDPQMVADAILAELTNLYLERPDRLRACAMIWPSNWRPPHHVLEEVLKALAGAPWLQSTTFADAVTQVPAVKGISLDIPEAAPSGDEYFAAVGRARKSFMDFSKMVFRENPLVPVLQNDIYVAESDAWRQWNLKPLGLSYSYAVTGTVRDETGKVQIPATGAITLAGKNARVPLTVVNTTGYRLKASFLFTSNGLAFPDGSKMDVTLEPKENLFEIPVTVQKTGMVRFTARLESDGLLLGAVDMSVRAGRFSTFAIVLVALLLGLIIAIWTTRIVSRRRRARHLMRKGKPTDDGDGGPAETEGDGAGAQHQATEGQQA